MGNWRNHGIHLDLPHQDQDSFQNDVARRDVADSETSSYVRGESSRKASGLDRALRVTTRGYPWFASWAWSGLQVKRCKESAKSNEMAAKHP